MTDTPPTTLTKDQILGRTVPTKFVDVPALGGKIEIRQYLVDDHMWVAEKLAGHDDTTGFGDLLWTLIRCCVSPKFEESDYAQLRESIPTPTLIDLSVQIGEVGGGAASVKAAEKSPVAE